jgi:hypothetical protein
MLGKLLGGGVKVDKEPRSDDSDIFGEPLNRRKAFLEHIKYWWMFRGKLLYGNVSRWEYWWIERPLEKWALKEKLRKQMYEEAQEHLMESDWEEIAELEYWHLRGLFIESIRRGIKVEEEWIDKSEKAAMEEWKQGASRFPPFSSTAKEMMIAAINKDRSSKVWRWITSIVMPLLGGFIGAYLGSK